MREELVLLFFNITEQQSDKIKYFLGSPREGIGKNNCFHFDDAHFFFFDVRSFGYCIENIGEENKYDIGISDTLER